MQFVKLDASQAETTDTPSNSTYAGPTDRARWSALLQRIAAEAFAPDDYAGQEGFISAAEALALARDAAIGPRSHAVDLCCGSGGLTRLLAGTLGCTLVGIDRSQGAIKHAARQAEQYPHRRRLRFVVGDATRPPVAGRFDVAVVFESLHGIRDKRAVLGECRRLLHPGGRLLLTLETGEPLSQPERRSMAGGQELWLETESTLMRLLRHCGFECCSVWDLSAAHAAVAGRLARSFACHSAIVAAEMGQGFLDNAVAAHHLWEEWLRSGRAQKLALVAERSP